MDIKLQPIVLASAAHILKKKLQPIKKAAFYTKKQGTLRFFPLLE